MPHVHENENQAPELRTGDERAVTQTESVPRFAPVRSLLELLTLPQLATVWLSNRRNALTAREARGRCGRRGDARPPHDDAARNQPPRQPGKAALVPVRRGHAWSQVSCARWRR